MSEPVIGGVVVDDRGVRHDVHERAKPRPQPKPKPVVQAKAKPAPAVESNVRGQVDVLLAEFADKLTGRIIGRIRRELDRILEGMDVGDA